MIKFLLTLGFGLVSINSKAQSRLSLRSMLRSKRLLLREVRESDLNLSYVEWLNNSDVNCYLETRFCPQSIESVRSYWEEHRDDLCNPWFAICLAEDSQHIGNIKLGPIRWVHRCADISLFIGERSCWGKGYAAEAISIVRDWAFAELDLQKLTAGIYFGNIASRRAFEKCGFELEGTLKQEVVSAGKRMDVWRFGLLREQWSAGK